MDSNKSLMCTKWALNLNFACDYYKERYRCISLLY